MEWNDVHQSRDLQRVGTASSSGTSSPSARDPPVGRRFHPTEVDTVLRKKRVTPSYMRPLEDLEQERLGALEQKQRSPTLTLSGGQTISSLRPAAVYPTAEEMTQTYKQQCARPGSVGRQPTPAYTMVAPTR
jgi:hypothetical protein